MATRFGCTDEFYGRRSINLNNFGLLGSSLLGSNGLIVFAISFLKENILIIDIQPEDVVLRAELAFTSA